MANPLFLELIKKQNKLKAQEFFDSHKTNTEYSELNKADSHDENWRARNLISIQIQNLRNMEQKAQSKCKALNTLFNKSIINTNINDIEQNLDPLVEVRIMQLINAALKGSSEPLINKGKDQMTGKNKWGRDYENIANELTKLINLTDVKVPKTLIDKLYGYLQEKDIFSTHVSHEYIMEKADLFEAMLANLITKNTGLMTIITGHWVDMAGQQLIEDVLAISENEYKKHRNQLITVYVKKTNSTRKGDTQTLQAHSIEELMQKIEQAAQQGFTTVKLPNEAQKLFEKVSALKGQAKSGLQGQAILTNANRNKIQLMLKKGSFQNKDEKLLSLIDQLYEEDQTGGNKLDFFKAPRAQKSLTLNYYANLWLSRHINKTALSANDVYLTTQGFITASTWIEVNKQPLGFNPQIVRFADGSILNKFYTYGFNKHKK